MRMRTPRPFGASCATTLAATIELLDGEDRFYRKHLPAAAGWRTSGRRRLAALGAPDIAALPRYRPPPRRTWRRYVVKICRFFVT